MERAQMLSKPMLITLIIVAIAGAAIAGLMALQRALNPESLPLFGIIRGLHLGAAVTIIRDSTGVPHIYAENDRDVFYALGFVHSQDRRLQMEILRRYARGEASSMTGESSLGSDRHMRTLELMRHAEAEVSLLSAEERDLHQAYADGVNAAAERARWPSGIIAKMLRVRGDPWVIADSLVLLKFVTVSYSTQYQEELLTAALMDEISPQKLPWFLSDEPSDRGVLLSDTIPVPNGQPKHAHLQPEELSPPSSRWDSSKKAGPIKTMQTQLVPFILGTCKQRLGRERRKNRVWPATSGERSTHGIECPSGNICCSLSVTRV